MAVFHVFCFWFSLRLGAIIIGAFALVQAVILLMFMVICLDNLNYVSDYFKDAINIMNLNSAFIKNIHLLDEVNVYLIGFSIFFGSFLLSCILLIIGAVQCKPKFMYAFVALYAIYIVFLLMEFMLLMMFLKAQNYGLGDLILYANVGGFILLFYLYTWMCVWCLIHLIKELEKHFIERKYTSISKSDYVTNKKMSITNMARFYRENFQQHVAR